MAVSCEDVLMRNFPDIDQHCSSYILGILKESGNDFESVDDLYDAVGEMLESVDTSKDEDTVKQICDLLFDVVKCSGDKVNPVANGSLKALDVPLQISSTSEDGLIEDQSSIWLQKKSSITTVDSKKLEKAENKLKAKQEKKATSDNKPTKSFVIETATASQQVNRKDNKLDASGIVKSYDVRLENFDVSYGDRTLISGADLLLSYGRRYGLIGRNGIGKTTLLRMLAGRQLQIPSHLTVLHVEQEVEGDDTEALESVLQCDTKRHDLLLEEKQLAAQLQSAPSSEQAVMTARLTEVYAELLRIEADKAPAKAAVILAGLGFSPKMQKQCTREFSGGWRMRLALARALFAKPDLLLLDEPTNMLDMKAVIWLENYLQTWESTILVVSHDREFLNIIAGDILHLHSQKIDSYRGNYEVFEKTKAERLKNQQREYEAQKAYRDHIQVFIDRFRYNANRASQVQSKLKLLEKLPPLVPVEKESGVSFRFPDAEKLSPPILQLDEVSFYYLKENPVFLNVCLSTTMDSRICIVGENGAGKTTLLRVLLGDLGPVKGIRHAHRNLRIGYFSQHHVDQMDLNVTAVEVLATKMPGKSSEYYRNHLGSFGISGELAMRPVGTLSGGQKSRVAFAVISMIEPNFFILDEPTNHLDMETIEALTDALAKFKGGVMLVSHDERLIRNVCDEIWVCGGHTVRSLEGGLDEYKRLVEQELVNSQK